MIPFLFSLAGLLNLLFYIFAIGFVISLIIEQFVKENERNLLIVQINRRYCWRQAWMTNVYWFLCNIVLYFLSRNMASPVDTFWNGM
tara:strand:- start:641 stop:901 length:261 start_codon:yes stop_codon:yes gene_type:complete